MKKEIDRKVKLMLWAGSLVFLAGMVIMGAYSMFPLFKPKVGESTMLFGIRLSMVLMGVGAAILILTMSFERYKEWKRMKEEISEEDLRP